MMHPSRPLTAVIFALLAASVPALADGIEDKAATCNACHGERGIPIDPKFPIIWGQHTGYILIQLRDMKAGRRKNEVMAPIVADLSDADMLALAEYYDAKEWPSTGYSSSNADQVKGQEVNVAGQCTQCHLGGFMGNSAIPRLADQMVEYLTKTTHDFKTHARDNNADMTNLMASYSDEDIATMSRYLAGQ